MADEYYVEGIVRRSKRNKPSSSGWMFVSFAIGSSDDDEAKKTPAWKRLREKSFPSHDHALEWLRKAARRLVREDIAAVRVTRVVSWHLVRPTVKMPLAQADDIARLTAAEPAKAITDPYPVPGEEWKQPKATDDDDESGEDE